MSSRRTLTGQITSSLNDRRNYESDVQPRPYVRPIGRSGFHLVRHECNDELVTVSGSRAFAPSTQVQTARFSGRPGEAIITEPVPDRAGISAFPVNRVIRELDILRILSADPSVVEPGFVGTVTLTGIGFRESPIDTFTAVAFNPATGLYDLLDPLAEVASPVWISSEIAEISLSVLSSAPKGYTISIDPRRS